MTSNAQLAKNWVDRNVVLAEHCDIEYSDLYSSLEALLDRATTSSSTQQVASPATDKIELPPVRSDLHEIEKLARPSETVLIRINPLDHAHCPAKVIYKEKLLASEKSEGISARIVIDVINDQNVRGALSINWQDLAGQQAISVCLWDDCFPLLPMIQDLLHYLEKCNSDETDEETFYQALIDMGYAELVKP